MNRKPVKSSNIKSIGFDNGTLEIEFHSGGIYKYSSVGEEIYKAMVESDSIGKYFHQYIKGQFTCKKVELEAPLRLAELLGDSPMVNVEDLKKQAENWIHLYSEADEDSKSCCRCALRGWIKYFFF